MSRIAERLFPWLAALIALTFLWIGIDESLFETGRRPHRLASTLVAFALSVFFGFSAASIWLRWRVRHLAALACGICLAAGTISALMKSWDEVNETVAMVLVAFTACTAVLALVAGVRRIAP